MTRFLAARAEARGARVALLGAPYDGTVSYRGGARWGPPRIREASHSLEEYSLRLDASLDELAFTDLGDLPLPFGAPASAVATVAGGVDRVLADGLIPFLIGGEHLVTLGSVRALVERGQGQARSGAASGSPAVVVFDAHADLRDDYLGERLSHATVARRLAELVGPENLYLLGVRSGSAAEIAWGRKHVRWFEGALPEAATAAARELAGRPVYVSVDIDVLDPAEAPGTGNPEPGGVSFATLVEALDAWRGCPIAGADLVEVAPPLDPSGRTEVIGAALIRHMLLSWFGKEPLA